MNRRRQRDLSVPLAGAEQPRLERLTASYHCDLRLQRIQCICSAELFVNTCSSKGMLEESQWGTRQIFCERHC